MLRSSIFAAAFALLSFTWAPTAALAQTEAAPASTASSPSSRAWVLAHAEGLGFGKQRLEGFFVGYGADAHVWMTEGLGVGVRYTRYASGAPDDAACEGWQLGGELDARVRVSASRRLWLWGAIGGGAMSMRGYPYVSEPHFDDHQPFVDARALLVEEWAPFMFAAGAAVVIVPSHGYAVTPVLSGGFTF